MLPCDHFPGEFLISPFHASFSPRGSGGLPYKNDSVGRHTLGVKNMRLVPYLSQKVHSGSFQLEVHVHLLGYSFCRAEKNITGDKCVI